MNQPTRSPEPPSASFPGEKSAPNSVGVYGFWPRRPHGKRFRFASWLHALILTVLIPWFPADAATTRPYYQRRLPSRQFETDFGSSPLWVDLRNAGTNVLSAQNPVLEANLFFDKRAAAAIRASVGIDFGIHIWPQGKASEGDLTEVKSYGDDAPTIFIPTGKCLAAMAYADYFPTSSWADELREMVGRAIRSSRPGWAGTFGPGVDGAFDLFESFHEGNYDMTQMRLLPIAYRYYDEMSADVREHLIIELLAHGRVHRPRIEDHWTHGWLPVDWSRAGFVSPLGAHIRIGETENHILMILTATYLTNQLLYQRNPNPDYDNRRNGDDKRPSCTSLVLILLNWILRNDFSEYNAKNYQSETRWALLNLCSYAYDHEVRLAARMVLDYISARVATSSNDLRRMIPFRRRNEGRFVTQLPGGFMDVGLLDWTLGADPMSEYFAMQTGNLRAYATPNPLLNSDNNMARPWDWAIASNGNEAVLEALSDYRLPPSVHDLFVNDAHRRFFQRLHRVAEAPPIEESNRNADNMEICAGSPSYLISAGGAPGPWAIHPGPRTVQLFSLAEIRTQLGVAVPTSFMPTGESAGKGTQNNARDLIQFGVFAYETNINVLNEPNYRPRVANYGVAPDFACGHTVHLPEWVKSAAEFDGGFIFVDKGHMDLPPAERSAQPGFYLAIFKDGEYACMEAFDTRLHPNLSYGQFKAGVKANNPNLRLLPNVETDYRTHNGNRLRFVIWSNSERDGAAYGAKVLSIAYGAMDPTDRLGDAGNITDRFVNGTILNTPAPAVVEITNPYLGTKITLDLSDPWRPRRVSETGEVEQAGPGSEVWVDFDWKGPSEGDFYRPFKTLAEAVTAVAPGGVIKVAPGVTRESLITPRNKRFRVVAPIGGVRLGAR